MISFFFSIWEIKTYSDICIEVSTNLVPIMTYRSVYKRVIYKTISRIRGNVEYRNLYINEPSTFKKLYTLKKVFFLGINFREQKTFAFSEKLFSRISFFELASLFSRISFFDGFFKRQNPSKYEFLSIFYETWKLLFKNYILSNASSNILYVQNSVFAF